MRICILCWIWLHLRLLNCITRCCKSQIVCVRLVICNLPLSLEIKQSLAMYLMYYWVRFSQYTSCILVCQNVAILHTISRQIGKMLCRKCRTGTKVLQKMQNGYDLSPSKYNFKYFKRRQTACSYQGKLQIN